MKTKISKDMVAFCLQEREETRNSDLSLANKICMVYKIFILGEDWVNMGNTITRYRRKFQQMGLYLPTNPEVSKHRHRLEGVYRNEMIPTKKENHENVLNHMFI